jgi:hypothetical protein
LPPGADSAAVALHLERATCIRGVVLPSPGRPLAGAKVRVFLSICRSERAKEIVERNAWTGIGHVFFRMKDGRLCFQVQKEVTTDDAGLFQCYIPYDGTVSVVVHARDHRRHTTDLGFTSADRHMEMALQEVGAKRRIVFSSGTRVLANRQVVLLDVTDADLQSPALVRLDEGGATTDEWFEEGRTYCVFHAASAESDWSSSSGFLRWDSRSRVDLENLSPTLDGIR